MVTKILSSEKTGKAGQFLKWFLEIAETDCSFSHQIDNCPFFQEPFTHIRQLVSSVKSLQNNFATEKTAQKTIPAGDAVVFHSITYKSTSE